MIMPPKIKTNRDDIVLAAFEIARREGIASVTAQSVSQELGTSVAPIFRVFPTIVEVKAAVVEYLQQYYVAYLTNYPVLRSKFISYGLAYIRFAGEEAYLFEILMHSNFFTLDNAEKIVSGQLEFVVDSAASVSRLSDAEAKELFFHIWLYTHGIACLVSQKNLILTEEEVMKLLRTVYEAFINKNGFKEVEE